MKTALITGITGQDGAYLAKFLIEKGYRVYGTVRLRGEPYLAGLAYVGVRESVEIVPIELQDLQQVKDLMQSIQPDEVYNLAAISSVAFSFQKPIETIQTNIRSTHNLLETIRVLNLHTRFYQASSSEIFGKVEDLPVTEKTVLHPVSPYAISKAAAHWLAINYREAYNVFSCCGILFNHESFLRRDCFVTKKVILAAVRISKGSDEKLELGNLSVQRDWGYAPEYVKAMWSILQADKADDFIIGSGESHSLEEFVIEVFAELDLNWKDHVEIDQSLYRPADIDRIYGSAQKVKDQLNWKYDISFKDLVKKLVEEELANG